MPTVPGECRRQFELSLGTLVSPCLICGRRVQKSKEVLRLESLRSAAIRNNRIPSYLEPSEYQSLRISLTFSIYELSIILN
jgi:hypothetical protein